MTINETLHHVFFLEAWKHWNSKSLHRVLNNLGFATHRKETEQCLNQIETGTSILPLPKLKMRRLPRKPSKKVEQAPQGCLDWTDKDERQGSTQQKLHIAALEPCCAFPKPINPATCFMINGLTSSPPSISEDLKQQQLQHAHMFHVLCYLPFPRMGNTMECHGQGSKRLR